MERIAYAEVARLAGLDASTVWRVFNTDRSPTMDVARRIADAMGITLEELEARLRDRPKDKVPA